MVFIVIWILYDGPCNIFCPLEKEERKKVNAHLDVDSGTGSTLSERIKKRKRSTLANHKPEDVEDSASGECADVCTTCDCFVYVHKKMYLVEKSEL